MRYLIFITLILFIGIPETFSKIVGEEVQYTSNGTTFKGYLAYDDSITGKRPGVLVVHEWWGHNEYARKRAYMLAQMGYIALAVDMYGDGKQAHHPEDASKFSGEVLSNLDTAQKRFEAAMNVLQNQNTTDSKRIAAIGYCFGGAIVLNMARRGVDLDGVISYHGSLPTNDPPKSGEVKARVLIFHGGDDKFITEEQIKTFTDQMKNANADITFITYPGVIHSFTNPEADNYSKKFNIPLAYNAEADKQSWDKTQEFLNTIFKEENN